MISQVSFPSRKLLASIALRTLSVSEIPSIRYSGGHKGPIPQGGFYASGRSKDYHPHRPEMLAMEADVAAVSNVLQEIQDLESKLKGESLENSLHTRASIKKLATSHPFVDCLARLECAKGEPIWGLSMDEREMVFCAREKVNTC